MTATNQPTPTISHDAEKESSAEDNTRSIIIAAAAGAAGGQEWLRQTEKGASLSRKFAHTAIYGAIASLGAIGMFWVLDKFFHKPDSKER